MNSLIHNSELVQVPSGHIHFPVFTLSAINTGFFRPPALVGRKELILMSYPASSMSEAHLDIRAWSAPMLSSALVSVWTFTSHRPSAQSNARSYVLSLWL